MSTDFTKLPEDILIDLINSENATNFDKSEISFSLPIATPAGSFRNAVTTMYPALNSNLRGEVSLYYNRCDLADVINNKSTEFDLSVARRIRDLIPQINARYGINLTPGSYIDEELPRPAVGDVSPITLTASPTSLIYIGKVDLSIRGVVVSGVPLSDIIIDNTLSVFTYTPPSA